MFDSVVVIISFETYTQLFFSNFNLAYWLLLSFNILDSSKITELRETSEKTGIEYIFNLSIDGCTKETYESTRLGGNFEKVISILGELKKYFTVKVTFTLKQTNLSDKDNIIQFFKQHSITGDNLIIGRDYFNPGLIEIQKNLEKKKYGLCE